MINSYQESISRILGTPDVPGSWALPQAALLELAAHLENYWPRSILELGSGASSLVIHEYAERTGARALTLESDSRYLQQTIQAIAAEGFHFGMLSEMRYAPLTEPDVGGARMYDLGSFLPDDEFDFVLIDGPTQASGGRSRTLPEILPYLAPDAEVWLDDASRPGERAALRTWQHDHGASHIAYPIGHGMARIDVGPHASQGRAGSPYPQVAITILTGQRPELLEATLRSLRFHNPRLLETATVIVLNNGDCSATADVMNRYNDVIDMSIASDRVMNIGESFTTLCGLLEFADNPYWLHLEDDWECATLDKHWLARAIMVLDDRPDVAQVRLRHASEPTRTHNMVTGELIEWMSCNGHRFNNDVHLTMNPFLARRWLASEIVPCTGERDMQRIAHRVGHTGVAQLVPGVFTHAGEGKSLRLDTGSPA